MAGTPPGHHVLPLFGFKDARCGQRALAVDGLSVGKRPYPRPCRRPGRSTDSGTGGLRVIPLPAVDSLGRSRSPATYLSRVPRVQPGRKATKVVQTPYVDCWPRLQELRAHASHKRSRRHDGTMVLNHKVNDLRCRSTTEVSRAVQTPLDIAVYERSAA